MDKFQHTVCDVCNTIISFPYEHNRAIKKPTDFVDVCKEHKEYAGTFLIEIVSENLGYKDVEEINCEYCNKELTHEEMQNSFKKNSFHYLCEKHLKFAKLFVLPNSPHYELLPSR